MTKPVHFLCGIQRSGSTLLGSILNQDPRIHVTPTSPVIDLASNAINMIGAAQQQFTFDIERVGPNVVKGLVQGFYQTIEKPIIIDKHRAWLGNYQLAYNLFGVAPKYIVTYRPIAETIASFLKLADSDPNNAIDRELRSQSKPTTNRNRAMYVWENWSLAIYEYLRTGVENHRANMHIVHYDNLINDPQGQLDQIYAFLEIEGYTHRLASINNTCAEQKDEAWGFKGLHDIRPSISKQSPDVTQYLDDELIKFFAVYDSTLGFLETK